MEDIGKYSLWVYPKQVKKIEEVCKGYNYFAENDLLLAKITPCFENGKMSIAKSLVNRIGFGSTEFIVLRAKEEVLIEWVYYYLRNSDFLEEGKELMTSGAGQQRIGVDFVAGYNIKLPSLEEQRKIIPKLEQNEKDKKFFFDFINRQEKEKKNLLNNIW